MNDLKIEAKSERGSRRWHIYMAMGDRYQVANAPNLREGLQECARNLGISAERIVREGLKDE